MGWRYTLIVLGCIALFVFLLRFVVFRFQESPKFLLYRGKDQKAVDVMHHVAKFNSNESNISLDQFEALTADDNAHSAGDMTPNKLDAGMRQLKASWPQKIQLELSRYKILFSTWSIAYLTILIWITYMFDYWGFSIAGE